MPDAISQDSFEVAVESIALLAVRDIAAAIANINKTASRTIVRWPLDIEILCDGGSRVFDFSELYKRLDKENMEISPKPTNNREGGE